MGDERAIHARGPLDVRGRDERRIHVGPFTYEIVAALGIESEIREGTRGVAGEVEAVLPRLMHLAAGQVSGDEPRDCRAHVAERRATAPTKVADENQLDRGFP